MTVVLWSGVCGQLATVRVGGQLVTVRVGGQLFHFIQTLSYMVHVPTLFVWPPEGKSRQKYALRNPTRYAGRRPVVGVGGRDFSLDHIGHAVKQVL